MAKKKHDAHHGGAWKVAYADFVTAMMALFMVLWILSQQPEIIEATARYFQDPYIAFANKGSGVMDEFVAGTRKESSSENPEITQNEGFLRAVARDFTRLLNIKTEENSPIEVQLTSDGLKITMYDRPDKPLFNPKTAELTDWGNFVLQNLAWLIERYNFRVFIDGHTAKWTEQPDSKYGPWELSADRANSARRALERYAVNPKKIERVTGYGDTSPIPGEDPTSTRNERITVSLSALPDINLENLAEPFPTPNPQS
ncbi:MAG: OmpA family protein [Chthoniobacterales bacterium]|nr:OmpA family protein [Chthoniobacterales bacterium]